MIKSLFEYDEKEGKPQQPRENKSETAETEESIKRQLSELNLAAETPATASEDETITQIRPLETPLNTAFENDEEIETVVLPKIEQVYADADERATNNSIQENQFFAVETETPHQREDILQLPTQNESMTAEPETAPQFLPPTQYRNVLQNENAFQNENALNNARAYQAENASQNENVSRPAETQSLTTAETIRQSGMAWSAAVGLFGSILFMMILGWFFDLLTGASPLGLVGGIVVGSGIGFYQFFRTTSQIFKK
jgi:F0F1-type ATP synthase assembly protein I